MQPLAVSPVLILLVGAVAALVVGIFLPRRRQTWNAALVVLVVLAAAAATAAKFTAPPGLVFDRSFAVDAPWLVTVLVLLTGMLLCLVLSLPAFRGDAREAEYYVMLLFVTLGAIMLAGAHDVMEVVLGVLMTSVASYALVAYRRSAAPAMEALLKYYLFGALLNIGLIYGFVVLYGLTGSTIFSDIGQALDGGGGVLATVAAVLVLAGLGFKAGYVPSHFWIPDVYQGTTVPVAAFLSVVPKLAAMLALARLTAALPPDALDWRALIAALSVVTMTWGNIAAFRQTDIRRLLGYSTIAQTGYLLIGVVALHDARLALPGLLYYFAAYVAANVGAFAVVAATGRFALHENRGLVRSRPVLAMAMLIGLLSLAGLPPLGGFVGKLVLFVAAVDAGYVWLAVVGLINSALSLYYYLRVLAPMFLPGEVDPAPTPEPFAHATAVVCAVFSLALGLAAFLVLDPAAGMRFA